MAIVAAALVSGGVAAPAAGRIDVIPRPASCRIGEGRFTITPGTAIAAGPRTGQAASLLAGWLSTDTGLRLPVERMAAPPGKRNTIVLEMDSRNDANAEAYSIRVEANRVQIQAAGQSGLVYGCQTLRQLMTRTHDRGWALPFADIKDWPRLSWRGLMLDCSRTFLTPAYLRRTIELMSFYKLNVLHLHLTDDQGWRIQIDGYPELTTIGSRFAPRYTGERGGYYSKQEMRDLIRFGSERGVTLLPEIEMPGHATAALAAYPELSCTGGPFEIFPFFKGPNVQKDVFCAGNERTFQVLEGVLSEISELFPGQYVHIGGDECPKDRWKACPKCQARMRAERLPDENALQAYFVGRIARFLESRHKRVIGWDEIAEGGAPRSAAVMFWRGTDGVVPLAKAGHDVVLSPTRYCYLDYRQSNVAQERGEGAAPVTLEQVYSFNPVPESFGQEVSQHVLGAQANMWTHYARTEEEIDKQIFPRLTALAEVVWTPQALRTWDDFKQRAEVHRQRLEKMGVKLGLNLQPQAAPGRTMDPGAPQ